MLLVALGAGPRAATVRVAIDSGLVSARSHFNYASVGGATRHTVVRLFVCLSFRLFLQFCGAR